MKRLLIPVKKYQKLSGYFDLPSKMTISSISPEDQVPIGQLIKDLKTLTPRANYARNDSNAVIQILRNRSIQGNDEYKLIIRPGGIDLYSSSATGAYYAIQTLRDLIVMHGKRIPCCTIHDWPDFKRRGVYYDCSRGKVPKISTVKALIERLAHWKVNELQLYIENVFTFKKHPDIGKGFSPYTPKDILDIQFHCKKHHMAFVPSLASFGHMENILMLPRYKPLAEMPGFRGLPGGTTLCPSDPGSIRLVADLYKEFVPLFEADDFNVCGDEPWELGQGRSKSRAKKIGKGKVYLDFILKIHGLCLKHGKRMNMWGDIVLEHPEIIPLIPKDIVMLNWDYTPLLKRMQRSSAFTSSGLPLVCCPGTSSWQSHGTRLQNALTNVSDFARVGVKNKAEGFLNTDWGDGGHRNTLGVSLCSFAHGAAHGWNTKAVNDRTFVNDFIFHTFGDLNGKLANAIKFLGDEKSGKWAYFALVESIVKPKTFMKIGFHSGEVIDQTGYSGRIIADRVSRLKSLRFSNTEKQLNEFEKTALKEFSLAADMDRLAWERLRLARLVRGGDPIKSRELRKHAREMSEMAEEFSRVWRIRNRPSRLRDNIAAFRAAAKEAERLSK